MPVCGSHEVTKVSKDWVKQITAVDSICVMTKADKTCGGVNRIALK